MMTLDELKKIIGRMFAGNLSADDRKSLAEEQPLAPSLEEQWHNGKEWHKEEKVEPQDMWNSIVDECWKEKSRSVPAGKKIFFTLAGWTAVAAVSLFAAWLIGTHVSYVTVEAPLEAKKMVLLPDSSKVWLNAAASIRYRKDFVKDRKVELEGEGFFDVRKMEGKPFIVHAGQAAIEVKGTEFNVMRMPETTTVTLFTGAVEFSAPELDSPVRMKPNEQIAYDIRTGQIILGKVDSAEYDWRTGKYKFVDKPLKDLIHFINRNYKVNVTLGDEVNKEVLFTGTIRREEGLMDVLDKICINMGLEIRHKDGEKIELY